MQPQQPNPAPPPMSSNQGASDPYGFIMNPGPPKKKLPLLPSGSSKKGRIAVVATGALVLIILASIISSVLSSSGKAGANSLLDVAAQQQELIRVSQLGVTSAKSKDTQNLAVTVQLTMSSDQKLTLARLTKLGVKPKPVQLSIHKDARTDALLTQASQNNEFDKVFTSTIQTEIATYQRSLKTAYNDNSGKLTRAMLDQQFASSKALAGPATAKN